LTAQEIIAESPCCSRHISAGSRICTGKVALPRVGWLWRTDRSCACRCSPRWKFFRSPGRHKRSRWPRSEWLKQTKQMPLSSFIPPMFFWNFNRASLSDRRGQRRTLRYAAPRGVASIQRNMRLLCSCSAITLRQLQSRWLWVPACVGTTCRVTGTN
jgi:hypothetical protein